MQVNIPDVDGLGTLYNEALVFDEKCPSAADVPG